MHLRRGGERQKLLTPEHRRALGHKLINISKKPRVPGLEPGPKGRSRIRLTLSGKPKFYFFLVLSQRQASLFQDVFLVLLILRRCEAASKGVVLALSCLAYELGFLFSRGAKAQCRAIK